jgi:Ca2+-transporting ATPase
VTAFELGFFTNPWLLGAIAVSMLLQVSIVTLPYAQDVFQVGSQPGRDWLIVAGLSLVPVTVIELAKLAWRLTSTRRP